MGSHPLVDDSKNGWLATLGCCAPKTYYNHEDEEEEVGLQARKSLEAGTLVFDQPRAIEPLRIEQEHTQEYTRPLTSYLMGQALSSWVETGRDIALRASSRASTTIRVRTWAGHPRRSRPNISISAPTDFRRLDERDAMPPVRRNPSFRRLELSIYLPENRLSPLPDFDASGWDQKLINLEPPEPALLRSCSPSLSTPPTTTNFIIQRKPVRSSIDGSTSSASHSRSSSRLSMGAPSIDVSRPPSIPWIDPLSSHPPTPPAHQINHSTASLDHSTTFLSLPTPSRPLSRINSPSPTPSYRSRAMTEPTRGRSTPSPTPLPIPQKRPSARRPTNSVDEAIRELNTIVEERRAADAYRSSANSLASGVMPISPSHHVPAIAPSLRMHVRSETLSDIGSAFSVPLASSKPLPSAPSTPFIPMTPGEKRPLILAKPLDMPYAVPEVEERNYMADDPYPRPSTAGSMLTLASTKSRISLWLRRRNRSQNDDLQMPTPLPTSPASAEEIQPFYQCTATPTPRAHAQHSSISSVSTYETTPSLSGRTDTTIASVVSPASPETPPSRRSRSWRATNGRATATGCAHETLPPMSHHVVDESHLISPLTPTKVGLAF